MSVEEDAKQARANALGALDGIADAKMRILERLDSIQWSIDNAPRDLALREAVKALGRDMHERSARPCATCQALTAALGEPFGCIAWAIEKAKAKPL